MISVEMKYGKRTIEANFREDNLMGILRGSFPPPPTPEEEIREVERSLREPIGSKSLDEIAKPGQKVVIMASDITRPVPSWKILPTLVNKLNSCGISDTDITIMFGVGIHRSHTEDERRYLVGDELYKRVKCKDSVGDPYIYVGKSALGTPYYVNSIVAASDLLICTGNIEYHWFAGYSGGAKAILPGASNYETIRSSHSRISHPGTGTGIINGNPIRSDIDGILKFLKIDFIVNVVIDDQKRILRSFAGHPIDAHRAGCAYLDSIYGKKINHQADVVVISCGGYPKDINLYQAQKALDNGNHAVREGGTIIMIGSCSEGYGDKTFEDWVYSASSPQDILNRIKTDFQLGGHKAASFAKVLIRAKIILITDMEREKVERMFIAHAPIGELQRVIDRYTADAESVLVIPQAGSIYPIVRTDHAS